MDREIIFIYVTCPNENSAKTMARTLIQEKRIACANVIPQMTSLYLWENKLEEASEVVVLLKTEKSLFDAVAERVKQLHSYETPCIVALSLANAEKGFAQWLTHQLR